MAKKTWQAMGIGVAAAALLAIQVTALWVAAPHTRALLTGSKAGKVLKAGQSVAGLIGRHPGDAVEVRVSTPKVSRIPVAPEPPSAAPVEIPVITWDAAEQPAAAPGEVVSAEPAADAVHTIGRPLVAPGCEQIGCTQPCPTSNRTAVAKGHPVAPGDCSEISENGDAQAPEAKDDRARERESRHGGGIGPIRAATLGSVW